MKHKSPLKSSIIVIALLAFVFSTNAQSADISGHFAFINLSTGKLVKNGEPLDELAPNIILRFTKKGTTFGFLAATGSDGTAFLPIEAGTYCAEAFRLNGKSLKLTERSNQPIHRCFTAVAGEDLEFSLTIDADEKDVKTLPSSSTQNHKAGHTDPPKPQ